jgi:DNA-binding response OmpR family regulator
MTKARAKILIVDDSSVVREAVALMLEEHGYEVVAIDSVFSFAQTMNLTKPDLVLVDVNMPAMNGDKLVQIAQKHHGAACPIVLFSDKPPAELERLARSCGAAGFLPKTGDAAVLARGVAGLLAKVRR